VKPDLEDLRHRFETFAARFTERDAPRPRGEGAPQPRPVLSEDYWENLQELFTHGVTERELRDLFESDTPDSFHYFTREVGGEAPSSLPWYKRHPRLAWRVFLAMAFRLGPARRLVFALAVPVLVLGWVRYFLGVIVGHSWALPTLYGWVLTASTLVLFLLVLELRDKLVLKGDLEIARQIQFGLLPFEPFARRGLSVSAAMRPANTVGGDYFDVVELEDGRIAFAVGDVAGKGIPAALLMALLQGSLRTLLSAGFRGADLVAKLNDHLNANIPRNRLITLFYAEYFPDRAEIEYVNAGHNPPFLLRPAGSERLPATGLALGVLPGEVYESRRTTLAAGERLFIYTDGVTEASGPDEEEYGEERLEALLVAQAELDDVTLVDAVRADVLRFCRTMRPRDDMTLMVVGRSRSESHP
jgi:sigma-B regulation protein RsbU (phosphoserine phosphatase)